MAIFRASLHYLSCISQVSLEYPDYLRTLEKEVCIKEVLGSESTPFDLLNFTSLRKVFPVISEYLMGNLDLDLMKYYYVGACRILNKA